MSKVTIKMKFLYLQNNLVEKKILILFDLIIICDDIIIIKIDIIKWLYAIDN